MHGMIARDRQVGETPRGLQTAGSYRTIIVLICCACSVECSCSSGSATVCERSCPGSSDLCIIMVSVREALSLERGVCWRDIQWSLALFPRRHVRCATCDRVIDRVRFIRLSIAPLSPRPRARIRYHRLMKALFTKATLPEPTPWLDQSVVEAFGLPSWLEEVSVREGALLLTLMCFLGAVRVYGAVTPMMKKATLNMHALNKANIFKEARA